MGDGPSPPWRRHHKAGAGGGASRTGEVKNSRRRSPSDGNGALLFPRVDGASRRWRGQPGTDGASGRRRCQPAADHSSHTDPQGRRQVGQGGGGFRFRGGDAFGACFGGATGDGSRLDAEHPCGEIVAGSPPGSGVLGQWPGGAATSLADDGGCLRE